jgi:hypothetical protein
MRFCLLEFIFVIGCTLRRVAFRCFTTPEKLQERIRMLNWAVGGILGMSIDTCAAL